MSEAALSKKSEQRALDDKIQREKGVKAATTQHWGKKKLSESPKPWPVSRAYKKAEETEVVVC